MKEKSTHLTNEIKFNLQQNKKIYFASDLHLGLYPRDKSNEREKLFVKWLDEIQPQTQVLFLLGDVFDFWYEYRKVIPRGFTRFLGKLCEFTDRGIEVHLFTGNHDVWMFDYLPSEIGVVVHQESITADINGKKFLIGHGDGLGKGDWGYKFLKACFTSKTLQFLYSRLHPNLALSIGHAWSKKSRLSKGISEEFKGEDKEHQILFARDYLKNNNVDYFVFGHRHIPMDLKLNENSRLINLGEWIYSNSFAEFDGSKMELKFYSKILH
jgi:UDP-2,3-diacylglucosamine hydrolase